MIQSNTGIEERKVKIGFLSRLRRAYRDYRIVRKSKYVKPKEKERFARRLKFYSQFVKEGDLCFDVGANTGNRVKVLTEIGARVVAIEPQKACCRVLKKKFHENPNVHVINKALDKLVSKKEFFIDRSHTLSSMSKEWIMAVRGSGRFSNHKWDDRVMIETTTLDFLIKEYGRPDFCKIDVEGFEFEVLQGLSQPINMVSFEFTSEYLEPALNCINYLSQLGQPTFNYDLGESMDFVLPRWVGTDNMLNILTTLAEKSESQGDIYARFYDEKPG